MSNVAQISIKLSNGQEAGKTINELTAQSAKFAREIKKLEVGSEDYVKATEDYKKVSERLKGVRAEAFNTQKAQGMLNSEMGQFIPFNKQIGGMIGTFQGLAGAIKGATISQRALNIAIAASGIGLIIIALVKLVQAFLSTQEGMDKVTAVTRPLMAIFERLKGLAQELGGSVFKGLAQILKGDIAEGLKTLGGGIKDAVMGIGGAIKEGAAAGTELDKLQKQIEITKNNMIVSQARLNRGIAEQSELARDMSKTEAERQAAAQKAIDLIAQRAKAEDDLLAMQIKKLEIEQGLNDTNREGNAEMNQLIAQREQLQADAARERVRLTGVVNRVEKSSEKDITTNLKDESKDRLKALEAEQKAREKFVKDSIEAETKAREERKKNDSTMLEDIKAQQQAEFDQKLESLLRMNGAEQDMINELFFTNQLAQEERDQMLYDSQKKGLEDRLALLLANGQQSSAAYQELYMNLLQLNHDYESKQTAETEKEEQKRKAIRDQGFAVAAGVFAGFAQLLSDNSKHRRKNLNAIKAAQVAEVGINAATEVQSIWKNANMFPVPFNTIIGIAQTAIALGRAKGAINRINAVQINEGEAFADGGVVKGPSHQAGGIKFSVGGQVNEMEGNEIILTKGVYQNPVLRGLASDLNVMGGGRSFALGGPVLQDRGMMNTGAGRDLSGAASQISSRAQAEGSDALTTELLREIVINTRVTADKPVLAVTQIREKLQQLQDTEQDATF